MAQAPGTTLGTDPQVAKVVAVGGGDVAEVVEAKADEDQTTRSSPTTGTLWLLRMAATDNSKRSMASSGASTGEHPCLPPTMLARDLSGS